MAIVTTNDANYTAIANAIRSKTGSTDTYTPAQMAAAIAGIVSGGAVTGLAYDMGEFVLENNVLGGNIYINHNLGEKPGFVLVWTDDCVGITNPDEVHAAALGFVWFNKIMGLDNWFTSSASGEGTTVNFTQSKSSTGMNVVKPTSSAYTINANRVTSEYFTLVKMSSATYYHAGITYKYFVSKAWWNIGGVASAD